MLKSTLSSPVFAAIHRQLTPRFRSQIPTRSADTRSSVVWSTTELGQFDFKEYVAAKVKRINEALDRAITPIRHPLTLSDSIRYTLFPGGKRMAPIIALASCELVGGSDAAAMPLACAAEMMQAMGIIHDDLPCMDDGELRRGRPTNHLVFGEDVAVLAGDALLVLAFEHVAARTSGVPAERVLRAVAELAAGARGAVAGQVVDLASEGRDVDLATVEYIHTHKTGKQVEAAAVGGAIVGGGSDEEVERVRRYARSVGQLYQVVDDILDAAAAERGGEEEVGKSVGKDAARGKATYPKVLGLEGAREAAWALMARAQQELHGFDSRRAAPLYHLASFVANRQK